MEGGKEWRGAEAKERTSGGWCLDECRGTRAHVPAELKDR